MRPPAFGGGAAGSGVSRFALVGGGGFIIDSALTLLLLGIAGAFWARSLGFAVALSFTFLANRTFSFGQAKVTHAGTEAALYVAVQASGAALNFCIFMILMNNGPSSSPFALAYLVVSAAVGLLWNYTLSRIFIYSQRNAPGGDDDR